MFELTHPLFHIVTLQSKDQWILYLLIPHSDKYIALKEVFIGRLLKSQSGE